MKNMSLQEIKQLLSDNGHIFSIQERFCVGQSAPPFRVLYLGNEAISILSKDQDMSDVILSHAIYSNDFLGKIIALINKTD